MKVRDPEPREIPKGSPRPLTPRWTTLRHHAEQRRLWLSRALFKVVAAGRRSGKTELAKRAGVRFALHTRRDSALIVFAAPTRPQAKKLYWRDLKAMVPSWWKDGRPSETELTIWGKNGARIMVVGMDAPDRIEGEPLDWICLDEFGNMKERAWVENVRPALYTVGRPHGYAWLIGVPEGRNHYYDLWRKVPRRVGWDRFHWPSADILPPEVIAQARQDLDELTFQQEYEASFVDYTGRAYYCWSDAAHSSMRVNYDPRRPLAFCFDFNVSPGVAAVAQELAYTGSRPNVAAFFTGVVGEVHITPRSNTPMVCRRLIDDWSHHKGKVICYGDPSGGAGGSAKTEGNDWELIRASLKPVFGDRLTFRVPQSSPAGYERARVNALNSRLQATNGRIAMLVDSVRCEHLIDDFDSVTTVKGGSGQIDKSDGAHTHLTDALSYYVEREHPVVTRTAVVDRIL